MTRSTSSRPFTGSRLSAGTLALAALAAGVPLAARSQCGCGTPVAAPAPVATQTYRLDYQTVYDERQVTAYRIEQETVFDTQTYTVQKPVWETQTQERRSTVQRPVWETQTREERQTVMIRSGRPSSRTAATT